MKIVHKKIENATRSILKNVRLRSSSSRQQTHCLVNGAGVGVLEEDAEELAEDETMLDVESVK